MAPHSLLFFILFENLVVIVSGGETHHGRSRRHFDSRPQTSGDVSFPVFCYLNYYDLLKDVCLVLIC